MSLIPVQCKPFKTENTPYFSQQPHDPPVGEVELKTTKLIIITTCYILGNANKLILLNPENNNHPNLQLKEKKALNIR